MNEVCKKCNDDGEDRRTLWMSCFYAMEELEIPFTKEAMLDKDQKNISNIPSGKTFYTLRVCKDCRAEWMRAIQTWFNDEAPKKESCGSGIFIRKFGANVEITREEWDKMMPGVEPVRLLREDEC